jgi:hypothetical protein
LKRFGQGSDGAWCGERWDAARLAVLADRLADTGKRGSTPSEMTP